MHRRALLSITTPSSLPIHHTYVCFTAFLCCRSLLLASTPSLHQHPPTNTHKHTHTHTNTCIHTAPAWVIWEAGPRSCKPLCSSRTTPQIKSLFISTVFSHLS